MKSAPFNNSLSNRRTGKDHLQCLREGKQEERVRRFTIREKNNVPSLGGQRCKYSRQIKDTGASPAHNQTDMDCDRASLSSWRNACSDRDVTVMLHVHTY